MKKLVFLALVVASIWCLSACAPKTEVKAPDNSAAMKARFNAINDAFNTGNVSAIDTLLSANSVDHTADTAMHMPNGPEGLKQMVTMFREGNPDLKSEVKMMAADGDVLMVYGTMRGTNTGPMMGMPPTNKAWTSDFVDIIKFDSDLKMTEHWGVYDELQMMTDMGLIPAQGPPAADPKKK